MSHYYQLKIDYKESHIYLQSSSPIQISTDDRDVHLREISEKEFNELASKEAREKRAITRFQTGIAMLGE